MHSYKKSSLQFFIEVLHDFRHYSIILHGKFLQNMNHTVRHFFLQYIEGHANLKLSIFVSHKVGVFEISVISNIYFCKS